MKSPAAISASLGFLLLSLASCGGGDGATDLAFVDSTTTVGTAILADSVGDADNTDALAKASSTTINGLTSSTSGLSTTSTNGTGSAAAGAGGVPAPVGLDTRIDFELFRYSLDVPPGFRLEFVSGRNGYLVWGENANRGVFPAYLDTSNFLRGDEPGDFANYVGDGEVQSQETIEVPVYLTADLSQPVPDEFVEATEIHFTGGFYGEQWVRIFELGDRSIVVSLSIGDGLGPDAPDPREVLDGVRMWDGGFVPRTPDQCSTKGLPPINGWVDLNQAQQATLIKISDALVNCDWVALEAVLSPEFTASFGGDDAIELWKDGERYDDGTLAILYDLLSLTPLLDQGSDQAIWPRAAALDWPDVDEAMRYELEELGYGVEDFVLFEDFGGYFGFRTAIDNNGIWQYYLAGD
ncbi:MAG: hypothetical protein GY939_01440 [Actinomycetia bacterium]|nr:hypothetical protein [Actinomycetes bacterium]